MRNIAKQTLIASCLTLLLAGVGPALADDHGEVRELVRQGEILPLQSIVERAVGEQTGQLLEVELEREDDIWVYELELLRDDGRVYKLYYDARTGEHLPEFEDD